MTKLSSFLLIAVPLVLVANDCHAVVEPITGVAYQVAPADDLITNTAVITSFTTAQGTVSDLSHAVSATGNFQLSNVGSDVRNLWASSGAEIDGVQAVMNLDISTGVLNAGDSTPVRNIDLGGTGGLTANFMFEQVINTGASGLANDFFLFENGGNDSVDILPLDSSGVPIGDFSLSIDASDWGQLPEQWSRVVEAVEPLTVDIGGIAFDLDDFTGTGVLSGVQGLAISGTTGLDPLVVGVNDTLAPAPTPTLTVNRLTGEAVLSNEGAAPLDLLGYQFSSAFGAINPGNWLSIADEYDATSGGEVDGDDEWSELTLATDRDDLSEFVFGGPGNAGDGGVLAAGQSISLSNSSGVWLPTFNEELTGVVARVDGTLLPVTVLFTGNGDVPLLRSDFNSDGAIDELDWLVINSNYRADLESLSAAEAYLSGDIDGSGINDLTDFLLFMSDFDAFNGAGAFAAMLSGSNATPEPTMLASCLVAGLLLVSLRTSRGMAVAAILCLCLIGAANHAEAVIIASEDFESYTPVPVSAGTGVPDFGEAGENGPGGWTSAWAEDENPVFSYIRSDLISDYGQGLEIGNRENSDTNIVNRQFTGQTDDFYVGLTIRTTADAPDANNHTLFYFSDSTGDDATVGYGAGTKREASGGPGPFFIRQGNNTSDTISPTDQVYGDDYNLVMKFTKSGAAADPFDQIDLWINQAAEGTPDITSTGGTASLAELNTFHVWFDPRNTTSGEFGYLAIDNLVVATTYDEALALVNDEGPKFTITAQVNSVTGEVTLRNETAAPISFNSYELVSQDGDTLDASSWSSLTSRSGVHPLVNPVDGDDPGSTAGDSAGEAWTVSGTPSNAALAEQFLLGDTTLDVGESISLGQVYDTTAGGDFFGRYTGGGLLQVMGVDFFTPSGLPGDFNDDGVVDSIDYAVWRENLGGDASALNGNGDDTGGSAGVVDQADFTLWLNNYGASSLAPESGADPQQTPEPTALWVLLVGGALWRARRRVPSACAGVLLPGLLIGGAAAVFAPTAEAVTASVRTYSMGDTLGEGGGDGIPSDGETAGSTFGDPFDVLDGVDSDGEFQDLDNQNGAIYHQITSADTTSGHPGSVGSFAIEFDGTDDFLSATALNVIDGGMSQGVQLWVRPNAESVGNGSVQAILSDTSLAGGPIITADGKWGTLNGGATAGGGVDVVGDSWSHVAQHNFLLTDTGSPGIVPGTGAPTSSQSVVYVNGIAVAANDSSATASGEFLVGASGDVLNPVRFFSGVLDELDVYTSDPDGFDLVTDNDFIAGVLVPAIPGGQLLPGDVNLDGAVDAADATTFISNWRREKVLQGSRNSMYVGDWQTRGWGDLDFNGRVDIHDAIALNAELVLAGAGGLDFATLGTSPPIPEPAALLLAAFVFVAVQAGQRQDRGCF